MSACSALSEGRDSRGRPGLQEPRFQAGCTPLGPSVASPWVPCPVAPWPHPSPRAPGSTNSRCARDSADDGTYAQPLPACRPAALPPAPRPAKDLPSPGLGQGRDLLA
ncbi:hypothetical protein I7I51_03330 [Histoplasma capsulatum]|uniref:Uncharacterized protein n=1 Tax=Ajellomyces capsulatus TaxID=5037 RepID=A0A8A1M3X0_AJECA|nr:hypothetical protein I7I51_03330 [Histoplasma capsulatum]